MQEGFRRLGEKGVAWVEQARAWVDLAKQAGKLALSDDYYEIKRFIRKIGLNRFVMDKKVHFSVVQPFDLLSKHGLSRGFCASEAVAGASIKSSRE